MNYTKGEWKVGEDNDVFTEESACIARICGAPEGIEESIVNAHLIAAAPKMYEALKNLVHHPTSISYGLDAQKALAEAEGNHA